MSQSTPPTPSQFHNPITPSLLEPLNAFRAALLVNGYTDQELRRETANLGESGSVQGLVAKAAGDSPRSVLIRTFMGLQPVARSLLERSLSPDIVSALTTAGVLVPTDGSGDTLCAILAIEHSGDLYLFRDLGPNDGGTYSNPDKVMAVSVSTTLLWNLTPRGKVKLALDLGTGQGFQAIHLARHADRVIATDLAARSLLCAATSAAIHGATIDFRQGNLFEPVAAERGQFDLIVSNPPFVIGPGLSVTSASAPNAAADDISRVVVSTIPAFLAEQGQGVVICNWGHTQESQWPEVPQRWLAGTPGCDTLVLRIATQSAEDYAKFWHESLLQQGRPLPTVQEWAADLRRRGFEYVTTGFVVLRRREASSGNWFRALSADLDGHKGHAAPQIQRLIASNTALQEHAGREAELLNVPMGWAPGVQRVPPSPNGETLPEGVIRLQQTQGFPLHLTAHAGIIDMLLGMGPNRPVRVLLDEAIARQPMDRAKAEANILAHIKALLERGYLGVVKQA